MTRTSRVLLAALLALPLAGVTAPGAHAYWTSACEFGGTIAFNPPLGSLPTSGTWRMDGDVFCTGAAWGTSGVFPDLASWHGTSSGTYTGNCVEATLSDGYAINFTVTGSVVAGYLTAPWYGAQAGVITGISGQCPLGPLALGRITTAGVGTAYLP